MAIRFRCSLGHRLTVDDRLAGTKVRCGRCGEMVLAPDAVPLPGERPRQPAIGPEPVVLQVGDMMERIGGRRRKRRKVAKLFRRWFRRKPRRMPPDVYEADPHQIRTLGRVGAVLTLLVGLSLMPVAWLGHLNLAAAPGWARAVLLLAGLQCVFLVWMLNAPDWATVWVVTLVFAAVTTAYAVAMATAMATPVDHPLALGMGEVRHWAAAWCGAMVVAMGFGTLLCGRTSSRWHRRWRQEMARLHGK